MDKKLAGLLGAAAALSVGTTAWGLRSGQHLRAGRNSRRLAATVTFSIPFPMRCRF